MESLYVNKIKEAVCNTAENQGLVYICTPPSSSLSGGNRFGAMIKDLFQQTNLVTYQEPIRRTKNIGKSVYNYTLRYKQVQKDSMSVGESFTEGAKYIIIDDVITSGSTLAATSELIVENGGIVLQCMALTTAGW